MDQARMASRPAEPTPRRVALCFTVLNEAGSLDDLFETIAAQSRPPDEIVVVDGGSTDGTREAIKGWHARGLPICLLAQPGATISQGRNRAIREARADVIAVTDAGVRLEPGWLEELVKPIESGGRADVVAGFFRADPRSVFELALGATILPTEADVRPDRFLPSSRSVAFTRAAWERVGGYPEWLDYCEDLVFDLALKASGCRFAWAPRALAHFRPRPSPRAFFLQYYRYARGDGKADLWRGRHALRYATYLALPVALILARRRPWLFAPLVGAMAAYVRRPYARLAPHLCPLSPGHRLAAVAWVPMIRLLGDVAKMAGYPAGLVWRLQERTTKQRFRSDRAPG